VELKVLKVLERLVFKVIRGMLAIRGILEQRGIKEIRVIREPTLACKVHKELSDSACKVRRVFMDHRGVKVIRVLEFRGLKVQGGWVSREFRECKEQVEVVLAFRVHRVGKELVFRVRNLPKGYRGLRDNSVFKESKGSRGSRA